MCHEALVNRCVCVDRRTCRSRYSDLSPKRIKEKKQQQQQRLPRPHILVR
jgi:hypothetical protein